MAIKQHNTRVHLVQTPSREQVFGGKKTNRRRAETEASADHFGRQVIKGRSSITINFLKSDDGTKVQLLGVVSI